MADKLISPQQLHQFDNLELLAKQVVEGFIIGLHKSPFHGFSVEFAEHRLYNPGDSLKNIDWKVYARSDRLYIKKYEEETNLRCRVVIDASSSMYFPLDAGKDGKPMVNKLRFSSLSAAALMYLLKKQRDAVGLTIFSNEIEFQSRARSTTTHHNILMAQLENLLSEDRKEPKTRRSTAAAKCLHQIAESTHKRSLVIIFSDMIENIEDADEIFSALQHLKHSKHEVILFHVVDKKHEINFEFENRPYIFIDIETGEEVRLHPSQIKDFYKKQMEKLTTNLKLKCGQFKIDFVEADINKDFKQVLLPYFVKRSKMNA